LSYPAISVFLFDLTKLLSMFNISYN